MRWMGADKERRRDPIREAGDLAAEMFERLKTLEAGAVASERGLTDELARLTSRLVQARRDHKRSAEDIGRLEHEIRQVRANLRALKTTENK
jgi:phage shock protein A